MRNRLLALSLLLLAACSGTGHTGSGVSYSHNPNAICPAPIVTAPEVSAGFAAYPENSLIKNFYRHYMRQQQELAAFQMHKVENCPPAFWVQDNVAGEFHVMPEGHPMREFFKTYVAQQRSLDAYYAMGPK